jgi:hypothetical protein
MADDLDLLLKHLKFTPLDHDLAELEGDVGRRLQRRAPPSPAGGLEIQIAVVCGALVLGLAIAQFGRLNLMPERLSSETIVLSDDSALAPSVRLEGGS